MQNVFFTHRTTEPSAINRWVASIKNIPASGTSSTFLIHFCFFRHLVDVDSVDTFDTFFVMNFSNLFRISCAVAAVKTKWTEVQPIFVFRTIL